MEINRQRVYFYQHSRIVIKECENNFKEVNIMSNNISNMSNNNNVHDENMGSYMQYVDQIKNDSQELTKQKLEVISDDYMNNIRFGKDNIDLILGYINLRLEDELSDDNRDDLCTIAEFLMIDPAVH